MRSATVGRSAPTTATYDSRSARTVKTRVAFAILIAGSTSTSAFAQSLTVVQNRRANVYGLVEAGTQVRPVVLTQTGEANVAGIIQAGRNPRASITQSGRSNVAIVGQFEGSTIAVGRLQMP